MRTIFVTVQNEFMSLSSNNAGAAGSYLVVQLEISFGDGWEDMTKKLYFYDAQGENAVYILLGPTYLKSGETDVYIVPIPAEPLALQGDMTLTIKGVTIDGESVEHVIYTKSAKLKVMDSAYSDVDGGAPVEPTATQVEQLLNLIATIATSGLVIGGAYSALLEYAPRTIVEYQGSSYITLKTITGVTPTSDGTNYVLFAEKGDTASWDDIEDKPSTFTPSEHAHTLDDVNISYSADDLTAGVSELTTGTLCFVYE